MWAWCSCVNTVIFVQHTQQQQNPFIHILNIIYHLYAIVKFATLFVYFIVLPGKNTEFGRSTKKGKKEETNWKENNSPYLSV